MSAPASSNFFTQIPHYLQQGANKINRSTVSAAAWMRDRIFSIAKLGTDNSLFRPFRERYIQQLDLLDAILFAGSVLVAATVAYLGVITLGLPFFALSTTAGFSIIILSLLITRHRTQVKCNRLAAAIYKEMFQILAASDQTDPKLAEIQKQRDSLDNINKFKHLKEDKDTLDAHIQRHIRCYENQSSLPDAVNAKKNENIKQAFATYLKDTADRLVK